MYADSGSNPRDAIDPLKLAAEMRQRASAAHGEQRDHFLWLANEWEQTAARFAEIAPSRRRRTRPAS